MDSLDYPSCFRFLGVPGTGRDVYRTSNHTHVKPRTRQTTHTSNNAHVKQCTRQTMHTSNNACSSAIPSRSLGRPADRIGRPVRLGRSAIGHDLDSIRSEKSKTSLQDSPLDYRLGHSFCQNHFFSATSDSSSSRTVDAGRYPAQAKVRQN